MSYVVWKGYRTIYVRFRLHVGTIRDISFFLLAHRFWLFGWAGEALADAQQVCMPVGVRVLLHARTHTPPTPCDKHLVQPCMYSTMYDVRCTMDVSHFSVPMGSSVQLILTRIFVCRYNTPATSVTVTINKLISLRRTSVVRIQTKKIHIYKWVLRVLFFIFHRGKRHQERA